MKTSQNGINLIKEFEGCRLTAYKNPGESYYTIGYGHCGPDVRAGERISQAQAEQMLLNDLPGYESSVRSACNMFTPNQNQFDALVSFCYNLGAGNVKRLCHNRTAAEIPEHITAYTNSGSESNRAGLLRRRNAEKKLFLTPCDSNHYNSHGILFVDGKAKGAYPGKNYHAKGTTQLYLDSTLKYAIDGSYLDDGEVCPMYLFSDGSALVEYRSNSGKCWKCGYVKYSEQLDNIW